MVHVLQRQPFSMVPEWLLDHPEVSDGAVRTYGVLCRYANNGSAWPSQPQLAKRMNRSERSVRGYLAELREVGAIRERRRFGQSTVYELELMEPAKPQVAPSPAKSGRTVDEPHSPAISGRIVRQDPAALSGNILPPNESHLTRAIERKPLKSAEEKTEADREPEAEPLPLVPEVVSAKPPKPRKQDPTWDAVCEVFGISSAKMPANERGRLNKVVKQLKEIEATPEEIRQKAQVYRLQHPDWAWTPTAILNHWTQLQPERLLAPRPTRGDLALAAWAAEED